MLSQCPSPHFSPQDISVPEAVLLTDLDEQAIRANHAAAGQLLNASAEGSVGKATAMIQMSVNSAMARALGFTL
jgi:hypothetical protein